MDTVNRMARKPSEGEKLITVGLRLTESEVAEVDALAQKGGVSRSEMCRMIVRQQMAIAKHPSGSGGTPVNTGNWIPSPVLPPLHRDKPTGKQHRAGCPCLMCQK
jgi:hypothetical protein